MILKPFQIEVILLPLFRIISPNFAYWIFLKITLNQKRLNMEEVTNISTKMSLKMNLRLLIGINFFIIVVVRKLLKSFFTSDTFVVLKPRGLFYKNMHVWGMNRKVTQLTWSWTGKSIQLASMRSSLKLPSFHEWRLQHFRHRWPCCGVLTA